MSEIAIEVAADVLAFAGILTCSFWAARSTHLIKKTGIIHPGQILILLIVIVRTLISLLQRPATSPTWIVGIHITTIQSMFALVIFFYWKAWRRATETAPQS